jgi:uncharacterized protein
MAIDGIFYIHATVTDLARAKRFYADRLGWKLHTDEPAVAGFWFGSGYLVIGPQAADAGTPHHAGGMHVAVRVNDLEAEHARLAQNGVAVGPMQRQPWGERNFSFKDPDGYLWVYSQHA